MYRRSRTAWDWRVFIAGAPLLVAPSYLCAQVVDEPAPHSEIERYLSDRGLNELLALHLTERLKKVEGPERLAIADRLGSLYVGLLDAARSASDRNKWESQGQELLKQVPEADSFNLRLNLTKARYLQAEDTAEKHRLRLVTPEERQEAERALHTVNTTFQDIGAKLNKRVEQLERKETTARDEDVQTIRADLSEARRLRSLAFYYAGWSDYYTAFLTGKTQPAEEALNDFGWLLNASGGRAPTVERAPASLLRYEHVARAAVGAALSESARGRDETALSWLDAIENAEGAPPAIIKQLFARRLSIYAAAKRWADIELIVRRRREPGDGKPVMPLEVGEARLLAVLTLEALDQAAQPRSKELAQVLADLALTDLITLGEVRHVQDLVSRYGSAPLAGDGFIVQYVRALQAYERARTAHTTAGENTEEPSKADAVINLYRAAAAALDNAATSKDAGRFADERSNAALLRGLATFYAGDLSLAADRFEQAFQTAGAAAGKRAEDSLWMAIVALDKGVEGGATAMKERLARLGSLYLQKYPKTDRAAKLLIRQAAAGIISEEKAVEILLGVEKDSPLYETARRQSATLLYTIYRRTHGADRDFAALRFAEISEEILRIDRRKLAAAKEAEAREITTQIVARVRQTLDAVLGMTAPDLERADKALEALDSVVGQTGYDMSKLDDEITYRRFQIAVFRSRSDEVTKLLDKLHNLRGPFADRADRMMYNKALAAARGEGAPVEAVKQLVTHGLKVMDQFGKTAEALKDSSVYSLHNTVADAAARVYRMTGDKQYREIAVSIDQPLIKLGDARREVLKRYAELGESAGDKAGALDCWRTIMTGESTTSPGWYEARYHSMRLLLAQDAARAREAMVQYKVLHPDFGPAPWGTKIAELDAQMGSPTAITEKKEAPR